MIKDIQHYDYIALQTSNNSFALGNVLYTYLLRLHKKVVLIGDDISSKYAFLPWYKTRKEVLPASVDFIIDMDSISVNDLYYWFKKQSISINQKMALSFYAAYLMEYKEFKSISCNGIVFAAISEIVKHDIDCKAIQSKLFYREPLSLFRLKAYMYDRFELINNVECVEIFVDNQMLEKSGASLDDAKEIAKEFLKLAHVREVLLKKADEQNKIITIIKDNDFEK